MSSIKNVFEETVANTVNGFCGTISTQLSAWLSENKQVEVTPEEICLALDVPFRGSSAGMPGSTVQTVMPTLPNYYAGTGNPTPKKRRQYC